MGSSENDIILVAYFMLLIHRIRIRHLFTFQDLLNATWKYIRGLCKFKQINLVYDSHVDG